MRKRLFWVLCSVFGLIIGAVLYGLYRQDTHVGKFVGNIFGISLPVDNGFSVCAAYYLPDYLWMFSMACALFAVRLPNGKQTICLCCLAILVGVAWELMQMWGVISGTADIHDVILYSMAVITAAIISTLKKRRK